MGDGGLGVVYILWLFGVVLRSTFTHPALPRDSFLSNEMDSSVQYGFYWLRKLSSPSLKMLRFVDSAVKGPRHSILSVDMKMRT